MDWKTWLIKDFSRYWYGVLCLAILVFGVGEVLRVQPNPTAPLTIVLWSLLFAAVLALEIVGYILLWKRDSPTGKRVMAFFEAVFGVRH